MIDLAAPASRRSFARLLGVAPVIAARRQRGVRVGRRFAALPHHLRATIGTADKMYAFRAAFAEPRAAAA